MLALGLGLLVLVPFLSRPPGFQQRDPHPTQPNLPSHPPLSAGETGESDNPDNPDCDPAGTLDALAGDVTETTGERRRQRVRDWVGHDCAAAVGWVSELPEGRDRAEAWEQVALAWSDSDLPAAMAWAETLPQGEARTSTLLSLGYEAARTDPLAALRLGTRLETSPQRDDLLAHTVSEWAGSDPDAACRWAGQIQDPDLHDRLVASAGISAALRDAEMAFVLVNHLTSPGEHRDRAIAYITRRWQPDSGAISWPGFPGMDEPQVREQARRELRSLREDHAVEVAGSGLGMATESVAQETASGPTDLSP